MGCRADKKTADRLPAVLPSAPKLGSEFFDRPRWCAGVVPVIEHSECVVIFKREAANETATHTECCRIPTAAGDGRRDGGDVSTRAFQRIYSRPGRRCWSDTPASHGWLEGHSKVLRPELSAAGLVLDGDDCSRPVLVVEKARQSRDLRA